MLLTDEKVRHTILSAIKDESEPIGSRKLSEKLESLGVVLSEAAIRYHLRILEERGYIKKVGNFGRVITEKGLNELRRAGVHYRAGAFLAKKEEQMYRSNFDIDSGEGKILVNLCKFEKKYLDQIIDIFNDCYRNGLATSPLLRITDSGSFLSHGEIGLYYISGIAIDGILLRRGLNVHLKYGGVVEFKNHTPTRFIEMIGYESSSISSVELFSTKPYSVLKIINSGSGECPATFREIPGIGYGEVEEIIEKLRKYEIGGFLDVGRPNQEVLGIPVGVGRCGMALVTSSTPLLLAREMGIEVEIEILAAVIDFRTLQML